MPVTLQTVIPVTLLSDSMPHPIDAAKEVKTIPSIKNFGRTSPAR
jgi:hypothetical protein